MKKISTAATAACMVFSATAAHAVTRPEPTEFDKPVAGESALAGEEEGLTELLLLGGAALIGIILALSSGNGNSPR